MVSRFGIEQYHWAIGTFLSRATGSSDETNLLVPVFDLVNHDGPRANSVPVRPMSTLADANLLAGVAPAGAGQSQGKEGPEAGDAAAPVEHIHLIACKDIGCGQEITGLYSDRGSLAAAEQDFWRFRWGFVPPASGINPSRADLLGMLGYGEEV